MKKLKKLLNKKWKDILKSLTIYRSFETESRALLFGDLCAIFEKGFY